MIACPQCQHVNPDAATHCEACFCRLPVLVPCPHCGAATPSDATFCGQCGNAIAAFSPSANNSPAPAPPSIPTQEPQPIAPTSSQVQSSFFLHAQSQVMLLLPTALSVIHLGKPNDRLPPDVDLSNFPHADVVSRVHATIRVEGDRLYLEDAGSANGTYVNHQPLPKGNRHLLQTGDRVSFGKGDLVSFTFQQQP